MASSASPDLKLEIMVDGENIGNWGDKTNTNLRGIEEAICQTNDVTFAGTATVTLSITDFSDPPQSGRGFRLNLTGTGTAGQILQVPDIQKSYIVNNGLSVDTIIKNSTATPTVTIPAGKSAFVYSISSAGVTNAINTLTTANVVGTFEISGNASVGGTLNIGGTTTSGNISADGSLNVGSNVSVGGTLGVTGDTDIANLSASGTFDVGGNASVGGTLKVTGAVTAASTLNVGSNVSVGGTLGVTGDTDVANLSANGTFDVSGNASVGGTLAVTGDSDVSNLSASGTLDVAGETSLGNVSADGTLDVSGNGSVGGTLAVTGDTDVTNFSANGTLDVSGNASVGGTFNINNVTTSKAISADGTLNVSGNASVGGTFAVTGDTDVANISANGTLDVSGNGSVGGTLNVEGDLKNTTGNLTVDPATQIVEVKGNGSDTEGQIQLNCHANSHGQIIKAQPHSEGVTNTMLLPKGSNSTLVSEIATQTLTNKTLGATSVDGTFNISGNASVGGTLIVTGDTDITNISADGTLDVSGNASVGGTLAVTNTITGSSTVSDQDGNLRDIPVSQNISGNYTLQISDAGNQININASNVTITVPTSVFAVGDIISIVSVNGCTATLACTAVNAVKAGDLEATASHTLDANGVASIMFSYSADLAVLTGNVSGVE